MITEITSTKSSAYFVRHTRSPKILADFNGGPAGEWSQLKTDIKKRICICKFSTLIDTKKAGRSIL